MLGSVFQIQRYSTGQIFNHNISLEQLLPARPSANVSHQHCKASFHGWRMWISVVGAGGWHTNHSARSRCASLQPGPPGSKPPTFARASCNVTGPISISSYCPGPHEAQYRAPNPEHPLPGQSECLQADGFGDGGLANWQHEPSAASRRQVRSWIPSLALGLLIKLWVRGQSWGHGSTRPVKRKGGKIGRRCQTQHKDE